MTTVFRGTLYRFAVICGICLAVAASHGGSLKFDRKSGYVSAGDAFAPAEGTIEFHFKPATNRNNEWALSIVKDRQSAMEIGFGPTAFMFMVKTGGDWSYIWIPKERVETGRWHHVACTFGKGRACVFLDGQGFYKNQRGSHFALNHLTGGELRIGSGSGKERFNGAMSEVRLSTVVRYHEDFAPPEKPDEPDADTAALWRLTDTGDGLADASPHGRNAHVVGTVEAGADSPFIPADAKGKAGPVAGFPCVRTHQPPRVDGSIEDDVWSRCARGVAFLELGGGGYKASPKRTEFRAAWDSGNLYLAAECFETDMAHLVAGVLTRDGAVFKDDCLELFLSSAESGQPYFHYAFNALGTYNDGEAFDRAWNSNITVATRRLPDRWVLEAAIPFSELKVAPPENGAAWRFNVAREHRAGKGESFSSWAALGKAQFHAPDEFAVLRFVDAAGVAGREFSNLKPHIVNGAFGDADDAGAPLAWTLADGVQRRETAYLSGVYVLAGESARLMARQPMAFTDVAGKRFQLAVRASAAGGATLGVRLFMEARDGKEIVQPALWGASPGNAFATERALVEIPENVARLTALELHCANGAGRLEWAEVRLSDLAAFHQVREAADVVKPYARPVSEPFASRHFKWASPLAGGPLRVLFIVGFRGPREAVELSERLQMEYDLCWIDNGTAYAYGAREINARLGGESRYYDVIFLAETLGNDAIAQAVRGQMEAGAGVVYLRTNGERARMRALEAVLPKAVAPEASDMSLFRHFDVAPWPAIPDNYVFTAGRGEKAVVAACEAAAGKGRIIALTYGGPAGTRGGLMPKTGNNPTDVPEWHETVYALLAKAALRVSGRMTGARLLPVRIIGENLEIAVEGGNDFKGTLAFEWRHPLGLSDGIEDTRPVVVAKDAPFTVRLAVPEAVRRGRGLHQLRVLLKDAAGATVDWTSALIRTEGTVHIAADHPLGKDSFEDGEPLSGRVEMRNASDREVSLRIAMELSDAYGRAVWTSERQATLAGNAAYATAVAPGTDRVMTLYHRLRVTAYDAQGALDRREWPVYLPGRAIAALDDFRMGASASFFRRTPADDAFAQWFAELGFNFTSEGGVFDSAPRLALPWHQLNMFWQPFHHMSKNPVRDPCLSDPAVLKRMAEDCVKAYRHVRKYGAVFNTMGDESELVRDGEAEVCFAPHTANAFREWVRRSYGSLDRVNAEWGTRLESWDAVEPIRAEAARKRGQFAQWVDFRLFMDTVWINSYVTVRDAIKKEFPDARLSFTNPFQLNPFSGTDHYRMAMAEDAFAKYARTDLIKEYRSFKPDAPMFTYFGYLESEPFCRAFPWWFALNGGDMMAWWSDLHTTSGYGLFHAAGCETRRSQIVLESARDLLNGVGKVLHDFPLQPSGVAMLYSQPSMHVAWIESDLSVGKAPWSGKGNWSLPSSNPFGLHYRSKSHFKTLIKEAGLQPDFLAPEQVAAGRLKSVRLFILPCSVALSDATIRHLREFVEGGGTLLTDMRAGLYNEHGRRTASRPELEALLGFKRSGADCASAAHVVQSSGLKVDAIGSEKVELTTAKPEAKHSDGRPALLVNPVGRGRVVALNFVPGIDRGAVALLQRIAGRAGVLPPAELLVDNVPAYGYERFAFARGRVAVLGLFRDLPPRPEGERYGWFGDEFRKATEGEERVTVRLPKSLNIYDIRSGRYVAEADVFDAALAPAEAEVYALLPYRVTGLRIDGLPERPRRGALLSLTAAVETAGGAAGDHVFRVELRDPSGALVRAYTANRLAKAGVLQLSLPLALNDPSGQWAITVKDILSGAAKTVRVAVAE